jgi:3-hydroxyisobutyrate dehydrogenase
MGLGMAANLVEAGHEVFAYDPSPERQELAQAKGIVMVDAPAAAATSADSTVFSVVRTKEQTEDVLFGRSGVISSGQPRTIIISSTLDPTMVQALAGRVADAGGTVIDATMSGGTWGADAGTLTLMVSGSPDAVERARPMLDAVSSRVYVVGDEPGTGQAVKLAVQLSFCIQMMAAFEALQAVKSHGVDAGRRRTGSGSRRGGRTTGLVVISRSS